MNLSEKDQIASQMNRFHSQTPIVNELEMDEFHQQMVQSFVVNFYCHQNNVYDRFLVQRLMEYPTLLLLHWCPAM